jgi:hypothetical protein
MMMTAFTMIFTASSSVAVQSSPAPGDAEKQAVVKQAAAAPEKASVVADKATLPANPETVRQKQLADDTAKLLTLANELKAEMDKSTKDTLSLSVMKKAEEIEKLARKVRGEMKASIGN